MHAGIRSRSVRNKIFIEIKEKMEMKPHRGGTSPKPQENQRFNAVDNIIAGQ
jgi:hypothetical protein